MSQCIFLPLILLAAAVASSPTIDMPPGDYGFSAGEHEIPIVPLETQICSTCGDDTRVQYIHGSGHHDRLWYTGRASGVNVGAGNGTVGVRRTGAGEPPALPSSSLPTDLHERLLGPVTPLAQWTDSIEQSAATRLAGKPVQFLLTEPANSGPNYGWLGPNYYDRTAWCYRYAAASGRADILARCRFYAREVSNAPMMAHLECHAVRGWRDCPGSGPANRDNHPLGLALAATDARDPATRDIALNGLARSAYGGFHAVSNTTFKDPRENGNGLLALALSHAVGAEATPARWGVAWDSAARAKTMLNTILAAQQPWGCWNSVYGAPNIETPVYMQGLTLAGLQGYADFVQNDSRIVPAVQRCVEWLRLRYRPGWSTGGWVYSYDADGAAVLNGNVYPTLSGMLIGPIGWLWARTRDARWHSLADDALAALVRGGPSSSARKRTSGRDDRELGIDPVIVARS